ncbi:hypothetical protein GON26_00665 [Flavobacterium sp. GA093]|uniref:Uncharacterized protein n=1 Tax=Flavobacterium hydrocarbonoxydans TaxID=2683249 RepID=A0A6I4NF83_9FLAO|nr:hypothetical protein [Flavobacterium hydrocarbonoxydans]MWB92868.1 hypothetical protein [Flavobacterium hydrocarbonoxydans]
MKKITTNKQAVLNSLAKMVANKDTVRLFLQGKTSAEALKQKGITLAKPL